MASSFDGYRHLLHAINFAAYKHRSQMRKDGHTPYINHPIGVANILCEEGGISDLATLQAAVLHDTVEDTDTTFEEIEADFGREVRDLVDECTDDKTLSKAERKRLQIFTAPHKSLKAKQIKLADKLHNLRDILRCVPTAENGAPWSETRCKEYFLWSREVVQAIGEGTNPGLERGIAEVLAQRDVVLFNNKS